MNVGIWKLLILGAALVLAACDRDDDDDGGATTQAPLLGALNAVQDMKDVTFLREEEEWTTITFGTATDFRAVDADQYDLNFDALLPGDDTSACTGDDDGDDVKDSDECTRVASVSINAVAGREYTIVLAGRYASPTVLVFDKAIHEFDFQGTDADGDPEDRNMEVQFFHLAETLGDVDVYIEPPGTNLSPAQVRATLSRYEHFDALLDEGEYVITLTAVADPSTVFFLSDTFSVSRRTRVGFAILDGAGSGVSTLKVARFRDQGGTLLDRRVGTQLRFAHVAPRAGNLDVYVGGDFTQPRVTDLAFEQTSAYGEVDTSALLDLAVDVTPAGNPGVFLAREEITLARDERATFFLLGSNNLDGLKSTDEFRRFATHARLRMVNGASNTLDFYVVKQGSNIATLSPTTSLAFRSSSGLTTFDPGAYDIVLTRAGSSTVRYGPRTVELAAGGIYTIVAIDTGESTATDVVLLDDFAP
ncbi:MAG TPA: DUF4397 domain-containing protein [Gammaproteobacteria bacterium]